MGSRRRVPAILALVSHLAALAPAPLYAESAEPPEERCASGWVTPEEGGTVRLDGAGIEVPPGAVGRRTRITIRALTAVEARDEGMANVTTGARGYRFEPSGTQFLVPVLVSLPYDPGLSGSEAAVSNLYTCFYDEGTGRWERLPRISVDRERSLVVSEATHFTDMINATLMLPEGPVPIQFDPNSIKSLSVADPSEGVSKAETSGPSPFGAASFRIPLRLLPGRAGMTPELALRYSSDGGSGLAGRGFDIEVSEITTDTRFGTPRYQGGDTYLLDGRELAEAGSDAEAELYRPRVEGGFLRIRRFSGENYWEVTDKGGVVREYGRGEGWTGPGRPDRSRIYSWRLSKVRDPFGNTIEYTYSAEAYPDGSSFVYLAEVRYTGNEERSAEAAFRAVFVYGDREDRRQDGRGGFLSTLAKRLERIDLYFRDSAVRSYAFTYEENVFGQSLLTRFSETDGSGTEFYGYGFDYYELTARTDGEGNTLGYEGFEFADEYEGRWGMGGAESLHASRTSSGGVNLYVGVEIFYWLPFKKRTLASFGASGGIGGSVTASEDSLADVNGDGLPDAVSRSGDGLSVYLNTGTGFADTPTFYGGIPRTGGLLDRETQTTAGLGASARVGVVGGSITKQFSWSRAETGFSDVNGDGYPDFLAAGSGEFYAGTGDGFVRRFWTAPVQGSPEEDREGAAEEEEYGKTYYIQEPLRRWKASRGGRVEIRQTAQLADPAAASRDGVVLRTYLGSREIGTVSLTGPDPGPADGTIPSHALERGDSLYLLLDALDDERGDRTEWNVRIRYRSAALFGDMEDYGNVYELPGAVPEPFPYSPEIGRLYSRSGGTWALREDWRSLTDADTCTALGMEGLAVPTTLDRDSFLSLLERCGVGKDIPVRIGGEDVLASERELVQAGYTYEPGAGLCRRNANAPAYSDAVVKRHFPELGEDSVRRILAYPGFSAESRIYPVQESGGTYSHTVEAPERTHPAALTRKPGEGQSRPDAPLVLDTVNPGMPEEERILLSFDEEGSPRIHREGPEGAVPDPEAAPTVTGSPGTGAMTVSYRYRGAERRVELSGRECVLGRLPEDLYARYACPAALERAGEICTASNVERVSEEVRAAVLEDGGPSEETEARLALFDRCFEEAPESGYALRPDVPEADYAELLVHLDALYGGGPAAFDRLSGDPGGQRRILLLSEWELSALSDAAGRDLSPIFGAVSDGSGSTYRYIRPEASIEERTAIEAAMTLARCDAEVFPYYERAGSERILRTGADEAEVSAVMEASGLWAWTRTRHSVVYRSTDFYEVLEGVLPEGEVEEEWAPRGGLSSESGRETGIAVLPGFDGTGASVLGKRYVHVFDSAADYSPEDLTADAELAEGRLLEAAVCGKDPFAGGVHGWYYGAWSGYYGFDESLLTEAPAENVDLEDGEPAMSREDAEASAVTPPPYISAMRPNSDTEGTAYIGEFGSEGFPVDGSAWAGPVSKYSGTDLDENFNTVGYTYQYAALVQGDLLTPTRNGGDAYHSIPRNRAGDPDTLAFLQKSKGQFWDVNGGVSLGPLGGSVGCNWGSTWQHAGLLDMNGDRYPDLVSFGDDKDGASRFRVTYGTDGEFGETGTFHTPLGYYGRTTQSSWVFGASAGAGGGGASPQMTTAGIMRGIVIMDPEGEGRDGIGGGMGLNGGFGHSYTTRGFRDINGDGLPDHVARDGGAYIAALNLGSTDLSGPQSWRGGLSRPLFSGAFSTDTDGLASRSLGSFGTSINASFKVAGSGPALNIGLSATMNRTHSGLYDVNGDGLPDEVAKDKDEDFFRVRINLGDHFSDRELRLYRPEWRQDPSEYLSASLSRDLATVYNAIGVDLNGVELLTGSLPSGNERNLFASVCDPFTVEDVLDYQSGVTYNFGASVTVFVPLSFVAITIIPGINMSFGRTSVTQRFMDMDGDGLPDHVLKLPGQDHFLVRRNITGRVGLLKTLALPQGGSYGFEYESVGNTPDMPQRRWVMGARTRSAGELPEDRGTSEYRDAYAYEGGYYDRAERMFYGFRTVTTTRADGSALAIEYHNRSYHLSGIARKQTLRNSEGALLSETLTETLPRYLGGSGRKAAYFPATASEERRTYDPATGAYAAARTEYQYDEYGNVTVLLDLGNPETASDDLIAEIRYAALAGYFRQHPERIEVTDTQGNLLRRREGEYGSRGELEKLRQYHTGDHSIVHTLIWDEWGNLDSVTDPRGVRVSWEYDREVCSYAVGTTQNNASGLGPSYVTRTAWDYALGKPISQTDANDRTLSYTYDSFGRLKEVWSPYDTGPTPAVRYEYSTTASPWTVVTYNKLLYDPGDTTVMRTALAVDGLDRALQTAKEGEYRGTQGVRRYGWNLSGAAAYDGLGRIIAEGRAQFSEGPGLPGLGAMTLPTRRQYDGLGRVVLTTLPDGATMRMEYRVVDGLPLEVTTDPLGNIAERKTDARGNTLTVTRKDTSGQTLTAASYEYDALGRMLRALDARGSAVTLSYDLLGRRLSLESQESGRIELTYDESGNVIRKTDSVLRSRSEAIKYEYDGLGRLVKTDYPRTEDTVYQYGGSDVEARSVNAAGRLLKRIDSSGSTEHTYGLLGEIKTLRRTLDRLTPLADPESAAFSYQWDYLGRMQSITYPDGETVTYGYDTGGRIKTVRGAHFGVPTTYVADIAYDPFGQRSYIEYGNGVRTHYTYDEARRWLDTIHTRSGNIDLQNIDYRFDAVGNVEEYTSIAGSYTTSQSYTYDDLYQLVTAEGTTTNKVYGLTEYTSTYRQTFAFDEIGNLTKKTSRSSVNPRKTIGDNLNYSQNYTYWEGKSHQAEVIGNLYYRYDANGNMTEARKGGHGTGRPPSGELYREGDVRYADYGFGLVRHAEESESGVWARYYAWDEENRLTKSVEGDLTVQYRYGDDGQRAIKHTPRSETLYFDSLWQATENSLGFIQSKHVYVGQTRIATRLNEKGRENTYYEAANTYYYHPDHLGSAQLVTDPDGDEYERMEYTPYGELWVEKKEAGIHHTPFRFTGKELDEETGLYYYGARYLDPKTSVWISADPALGEYIPVAPVDDEARKHNRNLPGMGGVYNTVNLHLYHYAGNNPMKYTDPDGDVIKPTFSLDLMTNYSFSRKLGNSSSEQFRQKGCYVTALGNAQGSRDAYSYWGGFGPGLDFKRTMDINSDSSLFGKDSGKMGDRKVVMDKLFGAGRWDYWTTAKQGVAGMQAKLKEYQESGKKFLIVGIFDLSSATPEVDNHMVSINGLPGENGIFSPDMISPTSEGDKTRLSDPSKKEAYSMANLKEIRVIFLED